MFRHVFILLVVFLPPLNYPFAQASLGTIHFPRQEPSGCTRCLDGCAQRSVLTIIWSCLSTTVICAWSAVHPNIPPRERFTKSAWRRITLLVCTIIAPEILPAWALRETIAASVVRDLYNKRGAHIQEEQQRETSTVHKRDLVRYFYQARKALNWIRTEISHRETMGEWTLRHGHFLIMGGFHLVEPPQDEGHRLMGSSTLSRRGDIEHGNPAFNNAVTSMTEPVNPRDFGTEKGGGPSNHNLTSRVTILTFEILRELVQDEELNFRIYITEDEIKDKSKGDGLSKTIFIFQSSWFILQCLVRYFQGLGVTQFELTTGALASMNAITLLLWWKKPLGVRAPMRVYLPRALTERERHAGRDPNKEASLPKWRLHVRQMFVRMFGGGQQKRNIFFVCLRILNFVLTPIIVLTYTISLFFWDLVYTTAIPIDATHVSTFYTPDPKIKEDHIVVLAILGCFFGTIHILGYFFTSFPLSIERNLWLVASVAITVVPLAWDLVMTPIIGILSLIYKPTIAQQDPVVWLPPKVGRGFNVLRKSFQVTRVVIYVVARVIILGLAMALLRRQPDNIFRIVDWTRFIPHL